MPDFSEQHSGRSPLQQLSWWPFPGQFLVSPGEWAMALVPVFLLVLLWLSFWISPNFYFTYMLEEHNREYQLIEILTFVAGALAGLILVYVTIQFWVLHWWEAAIWLGSYGPGDHLFCWRRNQLGAKLFELGNSRVVGGNILVVRRIFITVDWISLAVSA